MSKSTTRWHVWTDALPQWVLGIGPVVILFAVIGGLFLTSPFGNAGQITTAATSDILWMLAIIGFIAGIVPVMIGMTWFPFLKSLGDTSIHAILALSAGVLVFVGIEMFDAIVTFGGQASTAPTALAVAVVGTVGTFAAMELVSDWHHGKVARKSGRGLAVAYIVDLGLGAHSIGEGIAIGTAFVLGEELLVTLLVIAFIAHNVTEGPVIVAAVASERASPPIRHFVAMGVIAGGPVIIGGWIGSLAGSAIVAVLFFSIGLGAILQVILEVVKYISYEADRVVTRRNVVGFIVGFAVMFLLEAVILAEYLV